MINLNFYDPGAKIRLMRKRFNMNQLELEDSNMTRAFISMMESGKRRVSKVSSKILAEKFNNKGKESGLELNLDDEYFSREPQEDARFYCENELKRNNKHSQLEELINIAIEFQLDNVAAKVYRKRADKYFDELDYANAFINYSNSLGKYKELKSYEDQPYIYTQMGLCKSKRNEYDDAIFYFNQAMYYAKDKGERAYFLKASYSLASTYFDMQRYNESIEILDKYILGQDLEQDLLVNGKVLKANSCYKLGKKKEAVRDYFSVIEQLKEDSEVLLASLYGNLGEYYYEIEEFYEAIKYINLSQKIKNKVDKKSLPYTLNTKGKIFYRQGLVDESIMIMELGMNMAEEFNNFSVLFEIYKELIRIYEDIDDLDKIKETSLNLLSIFKTNNIEEGKKYILTKLVQVALKKNDKEEAISLLSQLGDALSV